MSDAPDDFDPDVEYDCGPFALPDNGTTYKYVSEEKYAAATRIAGELAVALRDAVQLANEAIDDFAIGSIGWNGAAHRYRSRLAVIETALAKPEVTALIPTANEGDADA